MPVRLRVGKVEIEDERKPDRDRASACIVPYGFATPGNSASPIVGMYCGGTRTCVACS
jgi:hypothetical protein